MSAQVDLSGLTRYEAIYDEETKRPAFKALRHGTAVMLEDVAALLAAAPACADPVVETNVALLRSRSAVGIEKYGTTVAGNKLPLRAWLVHALEESLDHANYLQRAMMEIDGAPAPSNFQQRVQPWLMACFGEMIAGDREERNHRFLEESLELVQACGCSASEAHQLVDYVFGRDIGEPAQEVGGVMVTLAALCLANALDMHANGETELARIWTKVEVIRAKQAAKPKHSPLPAAPAPATPAASVDTAEFRELLKCAGSWLNSESRDAENSRNELIAHIDAHVARAVAAAVRETHEQSMRDASEIVAAAAAPQQHAQAALSEVDSLLKLIAEMQDNDWPGQGAPSDELARHWFAAYGRCADRAKAARAILTASHQPAAAPSPHSIGYNDDLPEGWTRAADGRVSPPPGTVGEAYTVVTQPTREQVEQYQRDRMNERFANRAPSPVTADFDLPAPNDVVGAAATVQDAARECLQDVVSHYSDFFDACHYRQEVCLKEGDTGDAAYWAHQIKVLGRMADQACAALAAPTQAAVVPEGATDEARILKIATRMPQKPWGIGSRRADAIAFALEVLKGAAPSPAQAQPVADAARYQRLRILGAAPFGSPHLEAGTVLCFQGLDSFIDEDIARHPSRGEHQPPADNFTSTDWNHLRQLPAGECAPGCPVYLAADVHALSAKWKSSQPPADAAPVEEKPVGEVLGVWHRYDQAVIRMLDVSAFAVGAQLYAAQPAQAEVKP